MSYSTVRIVVVHSDQERVLCAYNGKYSIWEMPGGRIERGESIWKAALRELKEETGLVYSKQDLIYAGETVTKWSDKYRGPLDAWNRTYILGVVWTADQIPTVQLGDSVTKLAWNDYLPEPWNNVSHFAAQLVKHVIHLEDKLSDWKIDYVPEPLS